MLPSRYFPTGDLVVDHQPGLCVGGADVVRGTLDRLVVIVKSIPYNSAGPPGTSREVTLTVH